MNTEYIVQKTYRDKEWLRQQYVVEHKELKEIAFLSGSDRNTIRRWIDKFQLQNGTEYKHGQCIYKELNDKNWLYEKYFVDKLSTVQVADLVGAKEPNSVGQALKRFGWSLRNHRNGIVRNIEDVLIINRDVIDGSLLGDCSLGISNKNSDFARPYLHKKNKYRDHLIWFAEQIFPFNRITIKETTHSIKYKNIIKRYKIFTFRTNSSEKLLEFYRRWYPSNNNYKKVVPADLILTPTMILNWFLDDGSSTWRKRDGEICKSRNSATYPQKTKQVIVSFCSESFTKEENEFLCNQIKKFGINASVIKSNGGTGWRIAIGQSSTNDFFDLIGECPVDSLKYKWKRP